MFTFNTGEHGDLAIPVRGESQHEAAQKLQDMFARMQTELAMEFPKVATTSETPVLGGNLETSAADGLSEILLERIDSLMSKLGGGELKGNAKTTTIKTWTELDFVPENYSQIVHKLELIASGGEELPAPQQPKNNKK